MERFVKKVDYLVDLHTASFGRQNSLYVRADMTDKLTARMAYLQRPQIIVHNPPADHSLRGAAGELGIPSITVEIGAPQRFQQDYIKKSVIGLRAVLAQVGMLAKRRIKLGPPPVLCSRSHWLYTDQGGLLEVFPTVTANIHQNERIARLTSVFGDLVHEYSAPQAGVVIGVSTNPASQTGSRILHLGIVANENEKKRLNMREDTSEVELPNATSSNHSADTTGSQRIAP